MKQEESGLKSQKERIHDVLHIRLASNPNERSVYMKLTQLLGGVLSGGVLEVDVREEKEPLNYLRQIRLELSKKGYEVTRTLQDTTKLNVYHLIFQRKGE